MEIRSSSATGADAGLDPRRRLDAWLAIPARSATSCVSGRLQQLSSVMLAEVSHTRIGAHHRNVDWRAPMTVPTRLGIMGAKGG